jgi:Na+-transporting NADH:ubiquinone oxidoreductase subunit A
MGRKINITRGLDIRLAGEASKIFLNTSLPEVFAVQPTDFPGVIPRLLVEPGDEVKAGSPLFSDKSNEAIKFCSPVSGEVAEIVRGDKRKVLEVKILADKELEYLSFKKVHPQHLNREDVIAMILEGGAWPLIRQRPFGIIANPGDKPKSVFISCFDTNPLAPDINFIMQHGEADFQTGIDALKKLTEGKIHLNLKAGVQASPVFTNAKGTEVNYISGPHPAGNVGVQIHHIDPVNKGEVVWCVNPQDVLVIGRLFNEGRFDASKVVVLTGSQVKNPAYYKTIAGASVKHIIENGEMKEGDNRIISGNVLTGRKISEEGFLRFYDSQITIIPEGKEPEFFGWLKPGVNKFSMSRTFLTWLTPGKQHRLNTNLHGEERPFVVSGQYEKVFPMDIYPVHLLKSILVEDVDLMEKLGIYEVVEEDFALCEFVCTSKIESQDIIRRGIEIMRKEFG